jgi:hypothetical protein
MKFRSITNYIMILLSIIVDLLFMFFCLYLNIFNLLFIINISFLNFLYISAYINIKDIAGIF